MSLLQWPLVRKTYAGIDNPLYVDDILVANQAVLDAAKALTGLGDADFRIISGLDFIAGIPNTYTAGIFYLNGSFYFVPAGFAEGLYLTTNVQDTLPEGFDDGNSRMIYSIQFGQTTNVPAGASPQMVGNMNPYRVGAKYLGDTVAAFNNVVLALGGAAFLNVGQVAGTVAAGDDNRLVYTLAQLDAKYAQRVNVIEKGTGVAYTPTGPNDPVNKAYADATSGHRLASGSTFVGDADPGGGATHTIPLGLTISVPYTVLFSIFSASVNPGNDLFHSVNVRSKGTTGFDLYFREVAGVAQDVTIDWIIFAQ